MECFLVASGAFVILGFIAMANSYSATTKEGLGAARGAAFLFFAVSVFLAMSPFLMAMLFGVR